MKNKYRRRNVHMLKLFCANSLNFAKSSPESGNYSRGDYRKLVCVSSFFNRQYAYSLHWMTGRSMLWQLNTAYMRWLRAWHSPLWDHEDTSMRKRKSVPCTAESRIYSQSKKYATYTSRTFLGSCHSSFTLSVKYNHALFWFWGTNWKIGHIDSENFQH